MTDIADVLSALDFDRALADLRDLARIPGISADGYDPAEVARSAVRTAELCSDSGLENVEVLELQGAHPYVIADWSGAPGAPTALVYAHHDVQPPGRPERWLTPAFEPTERDGRLYGRGVVDDKAGLMLNLAAMRAWFSARGALPINVKLIVEGEEEIGSPHLAAFLAAHRDRLAADVIVLSDTANLDTGVPALTTSLRGLVVVDVTVRAIDHALHSGMWGGPVADTATALVRLLARLVDDRGVIQIPGIYDDVVEPGDAARAALAALPFDEKVFRDQAGLLGGGALSGEADRSVWERLWLRPSLAFTALEGVPLATAANQLMDTARARVGLRLAPEQDAHAACAKLEAFLLENPPAGVEVTVKRETPSGGWRTATDHRAFEIAKDALEVGFGTPAVEIGCGGSIPFVAPFAEVLGGVPALLLGLEDPVCNAHGENESLHLGDFARACRAAACLFGGLENLSNS